VKLQLVSDLHLDFCDYTIPDVGADVLVIAGDVLEGYNLSMLYYENLHKRLNIPIVVVPGNHEFYHTDYTVDIHKWQNFKAEGIIILHIGNHWDYMGYRFLGDTMWTNVQEQPVNEFYIGKYINDFTQIKNMDTHKMSVLSTLNKLVLFDTIQHSTLPVIVVTHHAPTYRSIDEKYLGDELNAAFANKFDSDIEKSTNIKLWAHGHVHNTNDYMVGNTRVVSNPKGYNDENPIFNGTLVFDL